MKKKTTTLNEDCDNFLIVVLSSANKAVARTAAQKGYLKETQGCRR